MEQTCWADRGQFVKLELSEHEDIGRCIGASRLGNVQVSGDQFTFWIQLRGTSWVEAREGKFRLRPGQWIALEKDSKPLVQTGKSGVCVGLALSAEGLKAMTRYADCALYAGRGRMRMHDRRMACRLWRETSRRANDKADAADIGAIRPLLLHMASVQHEFSDFIQRCPGRSRSRKRQVFGRLQRARLYLEGNCDRVVRISELAELTSFSSWYFSKTFQSLYDESPQAAAVRLRLERAGRLLRETDLAVGEVAGACGFENACSFARAFRGHHGTTASAYRTTHASATHPAKPVAAVRKASNGS